MDSLQISHNLGKVSCCVHFSLEKFRLAIYSPSDHSQIKLTVQTH